MDPFNGATTSLPVPEIFQAHQPRGTTALWTHLLGKDARSSSNVGIIPPIAPIDKNATTMRVLLHDTQANFEMFSTRVDNLINVVEEAKREIKTTSALFEREHDNLIGDVIDLVNRSQTEIQKSIGTPTQAPATDAFFKDVDRRVEGLNQRLDAIHAFNQTHSQALQTQMQAILTLQEQQGTILNSVLPLLPLLQSIPLHLESLKTDLRAPATAAQTNASSVTPEAPTGINEDQTLTRATLARKRTHSAIDTEADSSSPLSSALTAKRARLEQAVRDSETDALRSAMPSPDKDLPKSLIVSSLLKHLQRTATSPTGLANASSASLGSDLAHVTPRRPLADLSLAQLNHPSSIPGHLSSRSNTLSLPRSSSPLVLGITPSATRPPRIIRVHTSTSGSARDSNAISSKLNMAATASSTLPSEKPRSSASHGNLLTFAPKTPARAPSAESPSNSNPAGPPHPDASTATTAPTGSRPRPRPIRKITEAPKPDTLPNAATLPVQETAPSSDGMIKSSPVPGQRERRSPFRAGRRFIPLVDTDDEDEDE